MSEIGKRNAGREAVKFVRDGSVLGLGTGSTVKYFLEALSERIKKEELDVIGIPTSIETKKQSESLGIKISSLEEHPVVDLDVDGADQVDERFCLIKGYGGALTREKIVAFASKKFICIVDETKLSQNLNKSVPVEVIPFAKGFVEVELKKSGGIPKKRPDFITDNKNFIFDTLFNTITEPLSLEKRLNEIPGVVENGIFAIKRPETVIIGNEEKVIIKKDRDYCKLDKRIPIK